MSASHPTRLIRVSVNPTVGRPRGNDQGSRVRIDIYSDVICPWCYIGKRRLERALAERPLDDLTLQWRAFQLNPDMPAHGMDRQLYLQLKFGNAASAERIYREIKAVGAEEDLAFAFDAIRRTPNTIECHRLIRFAGLQGRQDAVVEALFSAYFLDGEDIGAPAVLLRVAESAGLDAAETRTFLESDLEEQTVRAEDRQARRAGLQGVPTFIVNGKFALSGAHLPEVLHQMFDIGRRDDEAVSAAKENSDLDSGPT
jgi:predicted DsbA family dithiol-disulfide isomerase